MARPPARYAAPSVESSSSSGTYAVELDGRLCVYLPAQQHVVILNQEATRIWQLARLGGNAASIADALSAEVGIPAAQLAADVEGALTSFGSAGLDLMS